MAFYATPESYRPNALNLRHALVAVDRLCKLEGLYTVQIEGAVKLDARVHALLAGLNLTPQERSQRIAQLKAKAAPAEPGGNNG
ncbi:MAG: hypothetical protein MJE77_06325 [Proteobacteria bacterium]|nr:hypothetical protein [Pseudomonadota bacterium]